MPYARRTALGTANLTPLEIAGGWSTFANGGTQPLNVTFNQTGPAAAITMNGDSSSWTGNFTNNASAAAFMPGTGTVTLNGSTSPSLIALTCT